MDKFEEKRTSERAVIIVPVQIRGVEIQDDGLAKKVSYSGETKDISRTGLKLQTAGDLLVGSTFLFEIIFADNKSVKPKGTVIWSKAVKDVHYYGVQFSEVGIFDRLKLAKQIKILGKVE